MIDEADRLDAALHEGHRGTSEDVRALIDTATEIARSVADWRLSPAERDALYARAIAIAGDAGPAAWRRWRIDPRVSAVVGGAVVAAAAAAAIGVVIARGRRQHRVAAPVSA